MDSISGNRTGVYDHDRRPAWCSAIRLTEIAQRVSDESSGDLRRIAQRSKHDIAAAKLMLKQFKGIGNTGGDIYLREVQDVWTWVRPYFDDRTTG